MRRTRQDASAVVSQAARVQPEAIRDEFIAPLVPRIEDPSRETGRFAEAERQALARATSLEQERHELRAEVQLLREIERVHESHDDTEPFTPPARSDAPGREEGAHGRATPDHLRSWRSVAWRRLTGRS